jgi:hypothetical protein
VPGVHHAPALLAGAEPHVHEVIGHGNHVGVVLDHEHGVALVAQLPQDGDQPLVVARVQADRRLVEHVERADQRGSERGRQVDALRFPARERGRQAVQRQVVEPHVAQEAQAPPDLVQHLLDDRGFLLGELERVEEALRLAHRERRHRSIVRCRPPHVARLAAQPGAAAVGARLVAAIAAEEHADVHLVLLPLEPLEEAADALVVGAVALDDHAALFVGEVRPWHVQADAVLLGRALQLGQVRAVVRLGPRLDGALADRLGGIGHHEIEVELDDVAEAVARGARAERIVEREEARLRILVGDVAGAALEALRELVRRGSPARRQLHRPRRAAAFLVGDLDGVGHPRTQIALDAQAVHDDAHRRAALEGVGREIVEGDRLAVNEEAPEALYAEGRPTPTPTEPQTPTPQMTQSHQPQMTQIDQPQLTQMDQRVRLGQVQVALAQLTRIVGRGVAEVHQGQVIAEQQARAFGQAKQAGGDDLGGFADHFLTALAADGLAHAREEQAHVVVDLGDVPTVDRGLRTEFFWRMAMDGQMPSMPSTSGFSIRSRNWRA